MTFLWPGGLYLLAFAPATVAVYAWIVHRRTRFAVHYPSLTLLRSSMARRSGWRRHLPFAIFALSLANLLVAASRPVSIITLSTDQAAIILAMDVSRSMCSTDIQPTRLQAAEAAAATFIKQQRSNTRIGIIAFAGFAELIQPPTTDQDELRAALESLLTGPHTAIGSAILKSLDAISETDKTVPPSTSVALTKASSIPLPSGAYAADIIVLLTDGVNNAGTPPLDAAQQAADRGVRIYTIGFGTPNGSEFASCQSSDPSRLGGFGASAGGGFRRGIDETTLRRIAAMTGGAYYPASSARELERVLQNLPTGMMARHEVFELTVFFAIGGALLALLAMALSLAWHPLR